MGMMIDSWKKWTGRVADYTIGTVIVVVHMARAERVRRRLSA